MIPLLPNHIIPADTGLSVWPRALEIGDYAVAYSRGRFRKVLVEGLGPKNARVAYTTDSGHVTRKAVPLAEVYQQGYEPGDTLVGIIRDSSYGVEPGRHAASGFARRGRRGGDRLVPHDVTGSRLWREDART